MLHVAFHMASQHTYTVSFSLPFRMFSLDLKKLRKFDRYHKPLDDIRIRTLSGGLGKSDRVSTVGLSFRE